ncbi:MAG TPA: S8 family serine peptidase [Candidatus Acidoferrum sp.]|nr:S8 family serine peptidase [Candidatus Acidoferrum sp.]
MKKSVRVLSIVLSAAIMFGLAVPAGAEEIGEADDAGMYEQRIWPDGFDVESEYRSEYDGAMPDLTAADRTEPALPEKGTYRDGQLLVKMESDTGLMALSDPLDGIAENSEYLFTVPSADKSRASRGTDSGNISEWYLVTVEGGTQLLDAWNELLENDRILAVEPNYIAHAASPEDIGEYDPYSHAQGWLDAIGAPAAWEELSGSEALPGEGVTVAVVDTGVDLSHPDLESNLWSDGGGDHGYDFVNDDARPEDENGHGTHVAGIIAAAKNDGGVVGVAYGAQIMAVKVLDGDGSGSYSGIVSGIRYAVENEADIINMSLGGFGYSQAMADVLALAQNAGVLVVVAAGNEAHPTAYAGDDYYGAFVTPADMPGVLTVMAMDTEENAEGDWLAGFSNYDAGPGEGVEYELMAPGVDLLSTAPGGGYAYMSGTSMASPVAAGAAAVLMGLGYSKDETWDYLVNSGEMRQGKTQPDGTVQDYHTLDLMAAIEAADEGATYSPVIANCTISANCGSVTISGMEVALDNLNTSSLIFFQNATMLSQLSLTIENLGAASGDIDVTGYVGNKTVNTVIDPVSTGKSVTVALPLSGNPAKSATVSVNLTLTPHDVSGEALGTISVSREFGAYDFTLPSGIAYSSARSRFELSDTEVTVGSSDSDIISPILCLPDDLYVAEGQMFVFQYGVIYEESGVKIEVADGGNAIFGASVLLGNETFNFTFDGATLSGRTPYFDEYADFYSCSVRDPHIVNAGWVKTNEFYASAQNIGIQKEVKAYLIACSGFYNLYNILIDGANSYYNLVNGCVRSKFYGDDISCNSFVDNGNYLSDETFYPLEIYTKDYSGQNEEGFYGNCVVGPIEVYKSIGKLARIYDVYYQPVDATVDFGDGNEYTVLPAGTEDTILCSGSSDFYTDITLMYESGYGRVCPAFLSYAYLEDYTTDGYRIPYTLGFVFSAPVYDAPLYCYSPTDPFRFGQDVSGNADFDSSVICYISGSTALTDLEMTQYYELGGYYTQDYTFSGGSVNYYWATGMGTQSMYQFPIDFGFYSTRLAVEVSSEDGCPVLSWSGEDYEDGYYAKVFRIENDGEEAEIADVGSDLTFTDTDVVPGVRYTYTVRVYDETDWRMFQGSAEFAVNDGANLWMNVGSDSQVSTALTVGADEPVWFNFLEFSLVYDEAELDIESIAFSDEVKDSGLPYGASKTVQGEVTVRVGQPLGDSAVFSAGLMEIEVNNLDTDEASGLISIEGLTVDGETVPWDTPGCAIDIREGLLKLVCSDSGSVSIWREDAYTGSAYVAGYSAAGKMLGVCALEKGENSELSEIVFPRVPGAAVTVYYLNADNRPLRDCLRILLPVDGD